MKLVVKLAVLLLSLVVPLVVVAQTADVDWIRGTDFSRCHSFTWATGAYPIQDPDASLGMARAIQDELEGKGVKFVSPQEKFDTFVAYNAIINPDVKDVTKKVITIKVMLFDAKNNNIVWRAGGYVSLVNDRQENIKAVRALLTSMFQKYPPA